MNCQKKKDSIQSNNIHCFGPVSGPITAQISNIVCSENNSFFFLFNKLHHNFFDIVSCIFDMVIKQRDYVRTQGSINIRVPHVLNYIRHKENNIQLDVLVTDIPCAENFGQGKVNVIRNGAHRDGNGLGTIVPVFIPTV